MSWNTTVRGGSIGTISIINWGGLRIFIDENDQEVLEDQVMLDPAAPG